MASKAKSALTTAGGFAKGAGIGIYKGADAMVRGAAGAVQSASAFVGRAAIDPAFRQQALASAQSAARDATNYARQLASSSTARQQAVGQAKSWVQQTKDNFISARDRAHASGRLSEFYGEVVGRGAFELLPVSKIGKLRALGSAPKVLGTSAKLRKANVVATGAMKSKAGTQLVAKCEKAVKPIPLKTLAAQAGNSPAQRAAREKLARAYYSSRAETMSAAQIESHVSGIDLSKPVRMQTYRPGTVLYQHSAPGHKGQYFTTDPLATPDQLGIRSNVLVGSDDGVSAKIVTRVKTRHELQQEITVLESTAAGIEDTRSLPGQPKQTTGGGQQTFLPRGAHDKLK